MLYLFTVACRQMHVDVGDMKNAFAQSDRMKRSGGDIWVEACEGLGLPAGALILLRVPVYGLDDAPAEFRRTVTRYLREPLNFKAARG
eukprot:10986727-Alexandrium_andersonii.AAC.1